jgi:hypothetical protein
MVKIIIYIVLLFVFSVVFLGIRKMVINDKKRTKNEFIKNLDKLAEIIDNKTDKTK